VAELVKVSYRVCKDGTEWHWQVLGPNQAILAEGFARDHLQARVQAMRAAMKLSE
jgi:hypothetical protein